MGRTNDDGRDDELAELRRRVARLEQERDGWLELLLRIPPPQPPSTVGGRHALRVAR